MKSVTSEKMGEGIKKMWEGIKKVIIKICYTVIQTIPSTQWGRELSVKMPPKK